MRLRSMFVGTLVAMAVLGVALVPATATDHFQISSDDSQPVPERSFEFRDTTYQLDSFIVADSGEEINVSVTGPDEAYRLYMYNSDEQLVDSRSTLGNDTFTFDLVDYEPGLYALTVYQAGDYEAIKPLIVEGYDVSVDAPEQVTAGEPMSVRIGVERNGTDRDPAAVKAVASSGEDELVVNATGADGEYTADVEPGALESGNYTIYGVVQGEREAFDRNEVLGVSDRVSLSVRNATTTPTAEAAETTTRPSDPTPTPTSTPVATATRSEASATATEGVETEAPAAETEATEAGESAITPDMDGQSETTVGSGPGFSVVLTVVALALAVLLWGRRD